MYKQFFGFKERPFKLVPNPSFLFLSRCHEEALAHLTYAVSQGDGFVEITGEVGTGKTTLCRVFLEQLDDKVEVAYIFNPKLDSLQLLKTINDEFGIRSDAEHAKDLIDILNQFLMEKKAAGVSVIILIDEAQNLSEEVLEQLRLLSNLETTRSKLLQIILVGQPELGEKLDSPNLRQLSQRITLRYHLTPLSYDEMKQYIRHRINIAAQRPGIRFSSSACRRIYKFSGGIPRLINMVCDRALLTAYVRNETRISGRIVNVAISELARGPAHARSHLPGWMTITLAVFVFGLLGVLAASYIPRLPDIRAMLRIAPAETVDIKSNPVPTNEPDPLPNSPVRIPVPDANQSERAADISTVADTEPESVSVASPQENAPPDYGKGSTGPDHPAEILARLRGSSSRAEAFQAAADLWPTEETSLPYLEDTELSDEDFFHFTATYKGLSCIRLDNDFELIRRLNLPAVLKCHHPDSRSPIYLTLIRLDGPLMTLQSGRDKAPVTVDKDQLESIWSGESYILWKNFFACTGTIPVNCPKESILALKLLLKDIGFHHIALTSDYDERTRSAVRFIQQKHGIKIDGIAGPLTQIAIYNDEPGLAIPHLVSR